MDTLLTEASSFPGELKFDHGSISIHLNKNLGDGFKHDGRFPDGCPDPNSHCSWSLSTSLEAESSEHNDSSTSNTMLKFINEILMEEDLGEKPCMLLDCLALQAAEKSFYDVLNQGYSPSLDCGQSFSDQITESSTLYFPQESSFDSSNPCSCQFNNSVRTIQAPELGNLVASCVHDADPLICSFKLLESSNGGIGEDIFFNRSEISGNMRGVSYEGNQNSSSGFRGKKSHGREEGDFPQEGRSNKQSAVSKDEPEQLELFDEVLLGQPEKNKQMCPLHDGCENGAKREVAANGPKKGSNGKSGARRKKKNAKGEVVDLSTLLTQCARAVAINDQRSSMELIKQIRQHSSPYGDGNQRLAHYFVNGLEARLAGTEAPTYLAVAGTSAADILKAYQFHVQTSPFQRMSNFFANRTIMRRAEKATTLHIIDFGILYGFQWPCLIQRISERGCPPKIRMTGIELPQSGFRPAERVEETGRRLARYCERFGVEFEYSTIAKKWETIQLEDLKIEGNDFTVVNCIHRMKYLPDESVVMNSPRDMVLKLIRKIEPDLFVHGVVNGAYNAPFFLTRFREALFHFSSLFDMFDVAQDDRENEQRMIYEREVYGRDAMNVIACEGVARVERPETYKQWQVRNARAGFRQIPIYEDIFEKVKSVVRSDYHRDFIIDQDRHWVLQGWKGRVMCALSCWVPA